MSDAFHKLTLETHKLKWEDDLPFSLDSNDIFFQDDALDEIEHVFLEPNLIHNRILEDTNLVIGEIGFGFGLNFLSTCKSWVKNSNNGLLTFFSIDHKVPTKTEIKRLFKKFEILSDLEDEFFESFDPIHNGINKFFFSNWNAELILYVGDVIDAIRSLNGGFIMDAWYLDGFDPKANPVMWSNDVLDFIKTHSHKNTTVSTFSAAGFIRRGLTERGFEVERKKGFKFKRHHLAGTYSQADQREVFKKIAVVGSGIAGCSTAYHLAKNGHSVELFEINEEISSGASGNPLAALYPRFNLNELPINTLNLSSFFYADRFFKSLNSEAYYRTGIAFLNHDKRTKKWIEKLKMLNRDDLFVFSDEKNATGYENFKGVIFNHGGYLDPVKINECLIKHKNISVNKEYEFKSFDSTSSSVTLHFQDSKELTFDYLVLAHGAGLINFSNYLALSKGQLAGAKISDSIHMPINSNGYILPLKDGVNWIGSSYENQFQNMNINKNKLQEMVEFQSDQFNLKNPQNEPDSKAQIRVISKDKLPLTGQYKDNKNVFLLGGLGSRGFCYGPILGDHVASLISNNVSPLEKIIADSLEPNRFK